MQLHFKSIKSQFFGVEDLQQKRNLFLWFGLWLSKLPQVLLSNAYPEFQQGEPVSLLCPFPPPPQLHTTHCADAQPALLSIHPKLEGSKREGALQAMQKKKPKPNAKMQKIIFSTVSPLILRKNSCSVNSSGIMAEKVQGLFHSRFPQCC